MNLANSIGLAGVVIGIVGILVGVTYGRTRGRPVYKQIGNTVVTASSEEQITVQHAGKNVPRVTRTRVAFWNRGRKTLERSDTVADYPIRFRFPDDDTKILAVTTLRRSDEANNFNATIDTDSSSVLITFNYLDQGQGGLIEILHTCSVWGALVSGKIKGLPGGTREIESRPIYRTSILVLAYTGCAAAFIFINKLFSKIVIMGAIILVAVAFYLIIRRATSEPKELALSRKEQE
jgi:hypothetical protein